MLSWDAASGLEQAAPARENEIGPLQQVGFQGLQRRRRVSEAGQLIHAIVDHRRGFDVAREGEHQRGVEPQDGALSAQRLQQHVEHLPQGGPTLFGIPPMRHAGPQRHHVLLREGMVLEEGAVMIAGDHLLEDVDPAVRREAAHQVLRPLEHEVPPQMREADDGSRGGGYREGGTVGWSR